MVKSPENSTYLVVITERGVVDWFSEVNLASFATNMHYIRTRNKSQLGLSIAQPPTHRRLLHCRVGWILQTFPCV